MNATTRIGCLISTVLLVGCGGGGGGGDGGNSPSPSPVTNNLVATSLAVTSPEIRIGYPLKLALQVTAGQAVDNVGVFLYAVEKTSNPTPRQIALGTPMIPRIEAGSRSYTLDITIPSSVELAGAYFINARVDPLDAVEETSKADNLAATEAALAVAGSPNIYITVAALDRSVLELDTTPYEVQVSAIPGNVHTSDAAAKITVGADGLTVGATIGLTAFARLQIDRSDKGTSHSIPLYLWNSDLGRYTYAFGVDPSTNATVLPEWLPVGQFKPLLSSRVGTEVTLDDVDLGTVHLDFYLPGKLADELRIATRSLPVLLSDPNFPPPDLTPADISSLRGFLFNLPISTDPNKPHDEGPAMAVLRFSICVEIKPSDPAVVDRVASDNSRCLSIPVTLPPEPPKPPVPVPAPYVPRYSRLSSPQFLSSGYKSKAGDDRFASYEIDFGFSSSADNRGLIMETHASLPVTIAGIRFADFMKAEARAQLLPSYSGMPSGESPGASVELQFAGAILYTKLAPPTTDLPSASVSFSKGKDAAYNAFILGVPVTFNLGVSGNIGIDYGVDFTDRTLAFSAAPFVSLDAHAEGGIGISCKKNIPVCPAVVLNGTLTLVQDKLTASDDATIELVSDGFTNGTAEMVISSGEKVSNQITGISGVVSLVARVGVELFWGISGTISVSKELAHFGPAYKKPEKVLSQGRSVAVDVVVVGGQPPAYYTQ